MSAPARPCPPWCARKHAEGESPVHVSEYRWMTTCGPSLALYQQRGRGPTLNFDGVQLDLIDAEALAGMMRRMGHADIAVAVTELAAIGRGAR